LLSQVSNDDEEDTDEEQVEILVTEEDIDKLSETLHNYINRILALSDSSKEKLIKDLNVSEKEATKDWEFETEDWTEFIPTVNRFSNNCSRNFGRLLTPLVDGMRVSGPYTPYKTKPFRVININQKIIHKPPYSDWKIYFPSASFSI